MSAANRKNSNHLNQRLYSRRDFMRAAAGSAIVLLVGCRTAGDETSPLLTPAVETPLTTTPRPREVEITPIESFYRQDVYGITEVDVANWELAVDGLVERPVTLNYEQVKARPRAELMRTLECIGNPGGGNQIGNANWAGFWLEDLLAEVGVRPEAVRARFEAADGYVTSVAREFVNRPGVLMAYEMNGEPLNAAHGFPLRIFMPGLYGQKMPKWITRIEFIDDDTHRGYWERKGWSETAVVKTNSQIMVPRAGVQVPPASIELFGVAYAGERQITAVEVGVQSGRHLTWYPADLLTGPSAEVWTQFYFHWQPAEPGSYTLMVRATDEDGFTQSELAGGILEGSFPNGSDKIHHFIVGAG